MATCQADGLWHLESSCGAMALDSGADAPADTGGGSCVVTSTSSLPGVTIAFRQPISCSFTVSQAQAGIAIPYDVLVANGVADVVPTPQDAGMCGQPGSSGLILFERLDGGGQVYCLCDTGLCLAMPLPPRTLQAGMYANTFSWNGRNWMGPSDTGNPQGLPFPPGDYTLTVRATGTHSAASFVVSATLAIRLTP
jgi:hypothetical protein